MFTVLFMFMNMNAILFKNTFLQPLYDYNLFTNYYKTIN